MIESLAAFSPQALGELKSWLEPWFLQQSSSGSGTYAARIQLYNAPQPIADTTETDLVWLQAYDFTDGSVTPPVRSTHTATLIVPSAGIYAFEAYVLWASNATGWRYVLFTVNGTNQQNGQQQQAVSGGGGNDRNQMNLGGTILALAAGDAVGVAVEQNSGGSLNVLAAYIAAAKVF